MKQRYLDQFPGRQRWRGCGGGMNLAIVRTSSIAGVVTHLALEPAQEQCDDDNEGQTCQAGKNNEDGLLQPAGSVGDWGIDIDHVGVVVETWIYFVYI